MAHDHPPVTDEEIAAAKEKFKQLREQLREDLAEDLGGDPEDYDATRQPCPGGGESLEDQGYIKSREVGNSLLWEVADE